MEFSNFSSILFLILVTTSLQCVFGRGLSRNVRNTNEDNIIVGITQGEVEGNKYQIDNVTLGVFLGIPYAKPPVGNLRFARPQTADPWQGVYKAMEHKARCLHRPIKADPVLVGVPETEDCLYLDIYTPSTQDNELVPTMVYIHGGGFYGGSGALYNFTNLAVKGVVVVSINFRLDVFGFLSTSDAAIPGNFGLLDSMLALQWVKDNIRSFGGDPSSITVLGGSSGAAMVSALMLSPLSKDLFHKAILESGVSLASWAVPEPDSDSDKARHLAEEIGTQLNCSFHQRRDDVIYDGRMLLDCLRKVDAEALMNASLALQKQNNGGMIWPMVVEKTFRSLPSTPRRLLKARQNQAPIPAIYGYTAQDGSWLVPGWTDGGVTLDVFEGLIRNMVKAAFDPEVQDAMFRKLMEAYLPEKERENKTPSQLRDILVEVMTDASMVATIMQEARMYGGSRKNSQIYMYEFNYRPSYEAHYPSWYGVGHAAEKGFVQGLPQGPVGYAYPYTTEADLLVADHVTTLWTNFAKYGNPTQNWQDGVSWPVFRDQGNGESLFVIQENLTVKPFNRGPGVNIWAEAFVPEADGTPSLPRPLTLVIISLVIGLQIVVELLTKE